MKDISKRKMLIDTKSSFQVANKYYDTIILNHPNFSVYGYYLKILSYLNYSDRWNSEVFYNKSGLKKEKGYYSNWHAAYYAVKDILSSLKKECGPISK